MKTYFKLIIVISLMMTTSGNAGWKEGMAAANKGQHEKAYEEFLPLAESGHVSAQTTVGVMYYNGQGVPKDYDAALVWLNLAANKGHDIAQFNLAVMYDTGTGIDQDFVEAAKWYRLAANQGHARAQLNLGAMYENGDGVEKDINRAHIWFNIASSMGDDNAVEKLEQVEKLMTTAQIDSAQLLAGQCVDSEYQDC